MTHCKRVVASSCLAVVWAIAGCRQEPAALARKHTARGIEYAAKSQLREAMIEFRSALQFSRDNPEANKQLRDVYLRLQQPVDAARVSVTLAKLQPQNLATQLETAELLLGIGAFEEARKYAELATRISPTDPQGWALEAAALVRLNKLDDALSLAEQTVSGSPSSGQAQAVLGHIRLIRRENKAAEDAYLKAISLEPANVTWRFALARYYWATADAASAERVLRDALAIAPHDVRVIHRLGAVLLFTGRFRESEPLLRTAAADLPIARLSLAALLAHTGRSDEAIRLLQQLRGADKQLRDAATLQLAAISYQVGRRETSTALLTELQRSPAAEVAAHLLQARLLLSDIDRTSTDRTELARAAVEHATAVVTARPESSDGHYALGLARLAAGDRKAAIEEVHRALSLAPDSADVAVTLATLHLARGEAGSAIEAMQGVVAKRRDYFPGAIVYAQALRQAGRWSDASLAIRQALRRYPHEAALHLEKGHLAFARGDYRAARAAYEEAFQNAPRSISAARAVLSANLALRDIQHARVWVRHQLAGGTVTPNLELLLAELDVAEGHLEAAEARLRALAAGPDEFQARAALAELYLRQARTNDARRELEELSTRSGRSAGSLTMLAMLDQAAGNTGTAIRGYKDALRMQPENVVAANNLAWLLAQQGQVDEAWPLAKQAAEAAPDRAEMQDTFGWVAHLAQRPFVALAAMERAVALAPNVGRYRYRLGVVLAASGESAKARRAFMEALSLTLSDDERSAVNAALAHLGEAASR